MNHIIETWLLVGMAFAAVGQGFLNPLDTAGPRLHYATGGQGGGETVPPPPLRPESPMQLHQQLSPCVSKHPPRLPQALGLAGLGSAQDTPAHSTDRFHRNLSLFHRRPPKLASLNTLAEPSGKAHWSSGDEKQHSGALPRRTRAGVVTTPVRPTMTAGPRPERL
eukprot:1907591-Amphidinium_carterae.3